MSNLKNITIFLLLITWATQKYTSFHHTTSFTKISCHLHLLDFAKNRLTESPLHAKSPHVINLPGKTKLRILWLF